MSAVWALVVLCGLGALLLGMVWAAARKYGKTEGNEDELRADYEVKKGRDRIALDPDERKRLRDRFR